VAGGTVATCASVEIGISENQKRPPQ